jgi:hypothetical protein
MFQFTAPVHTNEHPAHKKQLKHVYLLCGYGDNTFAQTHSKNASSSPHK